MARAYIVYFRSYRLQSDDESSILGIMTTREAALAVGRGACSRDDDEYSLREFELNSLDSGITIWSRYADLVVGYRKHYARYWPNGFPTQEK